MIHLDTSFLIKALVSGSLHDAQLRAWIKTGRPLAISTIGWAEFLCGPVESGDVALAARVVPRRMAFESSHASTAARLFNSMGRRRRSMADCMIAAVAMGDGAALATANRADFDCMADAGLKLEPIQSGTGSDL